MNKDIKLNNWQEVIIDFFETRISQSKVFKAKKYIFDKEKDIAKEKNEKKNAKLVKARDEKQQELKGLKKDAPSTEIRDWIDENYKKIATVKTIKATHVLRFTHSSSYPGGILSTEKTDDKLLSTSSIKGKLILDLAHKNGAHISVSRFLSLELSGKKIIDLIFNENFEFLTPFKKNENQFNSWKNGFANMVEQREELTTADKAKQLYFPLLKDIEEKYHLIVPLFASSLANKIDTVITDIKYGEKQKEINKYRKNKKGDEEEPKYFSSNYVNYPNLAVQNIGGEHPKNVSVLNANRKGKLFLFSTQPPIWQSTIKPPIYKKSLFDNYYTSQNTRESIKQIVDFILRFEKIDLSIKNQDKKQWIEKWTNNIIDDFVFYITTIQNLPTGWSDIGDIKLKPAHQYLLDPYRDGVEFQANIKENDWQKIVVNDFVRWLDKQLRNNDKLFTSQKQYSKIFGDLMTTQLRELNDTIAIDSKLQQGNQYE